MRRVSPASRTRSRGLILCVPTPIRVGVRQLQHRLDDVVRQCRAQALMKLHEERRYLACSSSTSSPARWMSRSMAISALELALASCSMAVL